MRRLALCLVMAGAAAPAAASPVETLLSGIDTVPAAAEWRALDPASGGELRAVAADASRRLTTRSRAVSALQYFPTRETRAYLEATLADAGAPSLLRRKAAVALARGFGASAVYALAARAGADDARLRDDVARALGRIGDDRARRVLVARLRVETTWVRGTIERALAAGGR